MDFDKFSISFDVRAILTSHLLFFFFWIYDIETRQNVYFVTDLLSKT